MWRWFSNLRIAGKVAIAPTLAIIGLVLLSAGAWSQFGTLRRDVRYLNDVAFGNFSKAAKLQAEVRLVHAQLYRVTSLANANDANGATAQSKLVEQGLTRILADAGALDAATGDRQALAAVAAYRKAAQGVIDMVGVDPAMALMLMSQVQDAFGKLSVLTDHAADAADRGRAATFASASQAIDQSRLVFLLSAAGIAVLAASASLAMTRAIGRPVEALTRVMRELAGGARRLDIPYGDRRNELGEMAQAVAVFLRQAIEADRLSAEKEAARDLRERQRAAMERHTADFGTSVSGFMTSLVTSVDAMRQASEHMAQAAGTVHAEADSAAEGARRSSQDLTAVAAAIEQLTSSVAEISRRVASSSEISHQAVERAETGQLTMQQLADAASRIGDIVRLIAGIAAQTNLLALNATIEAARAGDAGKGFAVVAGEVKALAAQTSKATSEIGGQIETIRTATSAAVGEMSEIRAIIGKIDEVAAAIAAAVEQQSTTTREIAGSVQAVSAGTGQASRAMENVAAAAGSAGQTSTVVLTATDRISGDAERLRTEVGQFLAAVRADENERRLYERLSGHDLPVTLIHQGRERRAALRTISRGGASLAIDWDLSSGAPIELELPQGAGKVTGHVVRREGGEIALVFAGEATELARINAVLAMLSARNQAA